MSRRCCDARWLDAARRGAGDHLRTVFASSADPAIDAERRFALRQLEYAVTLFAEMQEVAALEMAGYSLADWLDSLSGEPADLLSDQENRLACRWQLDLIVALETITADLEEFKFWTDRAVVGARQVRAIMDRDGVAGFRALRARLRAKRAWDDWESEDIQRELGPWPT